MAEIAQEPTITVTATMRLNEAEIRALEALTGYNIENFLQFFYNSLGATYLKPHEAGLRSLFESVRRDIVPILHRTKRAREAFEKETSK